ncbi:MAG: hypothetical protein BWZ00_01568 [Bacteroidetes bacterium ADurb.BinA174]|nr:MAG: hypothetical protein BWZ00_01568 [Bacteroidetes bacterium ADurb.BinA174]
MICPICGEKMENRKYLNPVTYKTGWQWRCDNEHFFEIGETFANPAAKWTGEIVESEENNDKV